MSKQDDWTKTVDGLAVLMQAGLDAEDARNIFASIHGFRPDTGKPVEDGSRATVRSRSPRRWWRFWK